MLSFTRKRLPNDRQRRRTSSDEVDTSPLPCGACRFERLVLRTNSLIWLEIRSNTTGRGDGFCCALVLSTEFQLHAGDLASSLRRAHEQSDCCCDALPRRSNKNGNGITGDDRCDLFSFAEESSSSSRLGLTDRASSFEQLIWSSRVALTHPKYILLQTALGFSCRYLCC